MNFNDNQSNTIVDHTFNGVPGTLTNNGNGTWDTDVFQCWDYELTDADFPFDQLSNLGEETLTIQDDWDMNFFPYPGGGGHTNNANGNDYTYKLTLNADTTIYITTCDVETNHDVQIAIYNEVCDEASWILFQDDSNLDIYYPDDTNEFYEFACISGYSPNPTYANMLPRLELSAGTYYVVVDDRNTDPENGG